MIPSSTGHYENGAVFSWAMQRLVEMFALRGIVRSINLKIGLEGSVNR